MYMYTYKEPGDLVNFVNIMFLRNKNGRFRL